MRRKFPVSWWAILGCIVYAALPVIVHDRAMPSLVHDIGINLVEVGKVHDVEHHRLREGRSEVLN